MELQELMKQRSRLLGGGVVVMIHVLMWQALNYQLHRKQVVEITPIEVSLISSDRVSKPMRVPELSADALPTSPVVVQTPQVNVQEVQSIAAIAPEPLIGDSKPAISTTAVEAPISQIQLVAESEVDYLKVPEIRFPLASKRAREQGTAILSVIFDERGLVERISIYKTSGYYRLDEAALRAVRSVQVKPYIKNGVAMSIEMRVPVEFSLNSTVTSS